MIKSSSGCNTNCKSTTHSSAHTNICNPNLVYQSTFTVPVLTSDELSLLQNSNNSNCWCKKWSFAEADEKNFEEYLKLELFLYFKIFRIHSFVNGALFNTF